MEISNLLSIAKRWWWTLLLAALLAGSAGYMSTLAIPQTYESRVRMLVGPVNADNEVLRAATQLTRTYGELVTGQEVLEPTITALGLPYSAGDLESAIRPTADGATRILIIRVRDGDPLRSQAMANEVSRQLTRVAGSTSTAPAGLLQVVDTARPGTAVGVSTTLVVIMALVAGMLGSLTLVLLLEYFRRTVSDEAELIEVTGVDYFGAVPGAGATARLSKGWAADAPRGFIVDDLPDSPRSRAFRMLSTKVELLVGRQDIRSLLVLGVGRAQAAGELAANVGKLLSERQRCVTLLDANSQTAEVTDLLGLAEQPGLSNLLEQVKQDREHAGTLAPFIFTRDPRLFVLPYGTASWNSNNLPPAAWLLDRLFEQADFLVATAAPADRSAASLVWARSVDATLLVVPRDRVDRDDLVHIVESLRLVGANPIGAVFEERGRGRVLSMDKASLPTRPSFKPRAGEVVKDGQTADLPGPSS